MRKTHGNRLVRLTAVVLIGATVLFCGCSTFLKKSPTRRSARPQYAHPTYPGLNPKKQEESKSMLGSWFKPKEPEKPKSVPQWMKQNKRIDP